MAELAERQHGVVGRGQLEGLGFPPDAIRRKVSSGRLHPVHAGVYAVGHRARSQHAGWMAAVLACTPSSSQRERVAAGLASFAADLAATGRVALGHRSAAALWGIRRYSGTWIDVTVPTKSRSQRPIRRHFSRLPSDEITVLDGIPVTTVPRTIFDLAATSRDEEVESMLREAEYRRLDDHLSLPHLLARYPRRRGAPAIRAALLRLRESPGRVEGSLEERFLPFLDRHRLLRPNFNAWLEIEGERYRVDCLWPEVREIVELDGWDGHGTRSAFRSDRGRDRRLRSHGYGVTRLTWSQLEDEPEQIAADLRRLLAAPRR